MFSQFLNPDYLATVDESVKDLHNGKYFKEKCWLQHNCSPLDQVLSFWRETRKTRIDEMQNASSLKNIFQEWPRYNDFLAETTIEVDENGDEYEVKRFNIQGRQLNEGRSQCVVTRRKRATQPKQMYSDDGSVDDGDVLKNDEQQTMLFYSPPIIIPTAAEEDDKEAEDTENDMNINGVDMDKEWNENLNNTEASSSKNDSKENVGNKEGTDNKKEEDDGVMGTMLPQLQGNESAAVNAFLSVNKDDINGIVLVQSHVPPKVNPQTHAVFELIPVNHAILEADIDDEYEDETGVDFEFKEELTPVTTTAIWSTGDDSSNDIYYEEDDAKPLINRKVVKKIKKPSKANKRKSKPSLKPMHRNKYNNNNNSNSSDLIRGSKKRRPNNNNTRHRSPQKYNKNAIRVQNNNKPALPNNFNNKNKFIVKRNKNKKKGQVADQFSNTFTHTTTNDEDANQNVNCIIIKKEPPPTVAPSIWNIFGRSANGTLQASGHFGKRKRVNARFVA